MLLQKAVVENSFICMENGCVLGSTVPEGRAEELYEYTPCHFPATICPVAERGGKKKKKKKKRDFLC